MRPRPRLLILVTSLLACSFDATGLGESSAAPATTDTSATTTTAPGTTDTPTATGEPSTTTTTTSTPTSTTDPLDDSGHGETSTSDGPAPVCGDGVVDDGEGCDDGLDNGATRPCTAACALNVCGDGQPLDTVEACDDGNQVDNDECRNDCTVTPPCGNSKLDDGEQCDDGNELDSDGCIACKKAVCGDGFLHQNAESCDDGDESATCNADCSLAQCGDQKLNVSAGEVCDLGPQNGLYTSGCGADCKDLGTFCGDGVVTMPDENCDPAKSLPNAECTADCKALICPAGRDDCDGMINTGCEIDLMKDKNNCGECFKMCQLVGCKDGDCKL